jgi:hypothetical protein
MDKDKLSDIATRISEIANQFIISSGDTITDTQALFLVGAIHRQGMLLKDVGTLLKNNSLADQQSTLILCRCIIDDFLLILYLQSKDFSEEEFIEHTAKAREEQLKERSIGRDINNKYYNGQKENFFNNQNVEQLEKEWYNDPDNHKYLSDVKQKKFKQFPTTRELVKNLPMGPMFAANATSFYTWKYLSSYVHYSLLTFQKQTTPGVREMELEPIHETLSCSYKNIILMIEALNKHFGVKAVFNDVTDVWSEIKTALE